MTSLTSELRIEAEGGGWLTLHQPDPALTNASAQVLLERTAALPGWLRYTRTPEGTVEMLGEVRLDACEGDWERARARLRNQWEKGPGPEPTEEAVEAALDGTRLTWTRTDAAWTATPEGEPCQMKLTRAPGGVCLAATVAEWDQLGEAEQRALAHFLTAAQAGLRCARCELTAHEARIVARVGGDHLDEDLAQGLAGVTTGCHILRFAIRALLDPETAARYLAFHGQAEKE